MGFFIACRTFAGGVLAVSESVAFGRFPAYRQSIPWPERGFFPDSGQPGQSSARGLCPRSLWLNNGLNRVRADIYEDLSAMLTATGRRPALVVASAYRDQEYQQGLLEEDMAILAGAGYSRDDLSLKPRTTMPPGYATRHETGLALDIVAGQPAPGRSAGRNAGKHLVARKLLEMRLYPALPRGAGSASIRRGTSAMWAARQPGDHAPGPHAGEYLAQ